MMKLVVQEFVTLDGVSQGPGSPDEDTSDGFARGGWFVPHLDEEFDRLVGTWLGEADAFLFGRRTYENFARDWPKMTDHPFAGILNGLPKYVASHSLTRADWNPTTILSGDVPAQVAELKRQPGRELQIHGSARLAQSLLQPGDLAYWGVNLKGVTAGERSSVDRLGLRVVDTADAIADPAGSMSSLLHGWAEDYDAVLVHLDIDLINFLELPLSEEITRVGGMPPAAAAEGVRTALRIGTAAGLTVTEANPDHDPDGTAIRDLVSTITTVLAPPTMHQV